MSEHTQRQRGGGGLSNRVPPGGVAGRSRLAGQQTQGTKPLLVSLSRDPFTRQHEPQPPVERPAVATAAALPGTLSVLSSYLSGWLSDQTHPRKIFVTMAALIYTAGFTLVALISSFNLFLIAMAICGIGFGMYSA